MALFFILLAALLVLVIANKDTLGLNFESEKKRKQRMQSSEISATLLNNYNSYGHHTNVFDSPQPVTGDHYKRYLMGEDDHFDYIRCEFADSGTCANCARRREYVHEGSYSYSMGGDCKSREITLS